jgi:branched-chain amino acid aminotransferase
MAEVSGSAWINGKRMPASEATISIFDSGFMCGVSVFNTLACWQGGIFKLGAHLCRFERSAHAVMIPLFVSCDELADVVVETTRRSGLRDAYVQVIATRGRRVSPSAWSDEPTLIVYAVPYVWIVPREKVKTGISVVIPSIRNQPSTVLDPKIKRFWTQFRPGASLPRSVVSGFADRRARRRQVRQEGHGVPDM